MCIDPVTPNSDQEQPVVPTFSHKQKEDFSKLACSFLYENGFEAETISNLEIEIRFKPQPKSPISLLTLGCVEGIPEPGDPCFRKRKVWGVIP